MLKKLLQAAARKFGFGTPAAILETAAKPAAIVDAKPTKKKGFGGYGRSRASRIVTGYRFRTRSVRAVH